VPAVIGAGPASHRSGLTGTTQDHPRPASGLRSLDRVANVAMCDGSVRTISQGVKLEIWQAPAGRNDGMVVPNC
jgi:prepilin-type processing-associated H-X9-DG protein